MSAHEDLVDVLPKPDGDVSKLTRAEWLPEQRAVRGRRGWMMRRLLLVSDVLALTISVVLTELAFWGTDTVDIGDLGEVGDLLVFAASLPLWVLAIKLFGLYDRDERHADHSSTDEAARVFHLVTTVAWGGFLVLLVPGIGSLDAGELATFWALTIVFVSCGRLLVRAYGHRQPWYTQNAAILGAGEIGQLIGRKLLSHPEYGLHLVGFVDSAPKERRPDLDDLTILGAPDQLIEIVEAHGIERVVVAFSNEPHTDVLDLLRALEECDVQVDIVPRLFEIIAPAMDIHSIEGLPVVSLLRLRLSRSSRLIKRAVDLGFTVGLLILLAPLLAMIALAIKLDSRGPVVFRQVRVGTGGRNFAILKFRTMVADADARKPSVASLNKHARAGDPRMFKIADDPRVTRVGRILRRYSLDELPQLLNVLRGQMSLVGPRPLILDEAAHVEHWGQRRLDLKPGMTGLWQVTGRSEMLFDEMVNLDYLYVTSWSLGGDLRLMARTLPSIWRTRNAY